MSDTIKGFFKTVRDEIFYFAFAALKSGSANVGKQLVNVTSDENRDEQQSSSFQLGTFATALKTGLLDTSQDLMTLGLERIKASSPQEQNSKMSEESTGTELSAEGK